MKERGKAIWRGKPKGEAGRLCGKKKIVSTSKTKVGGTAAWMSGKKANGGGKIKELTREK